MQPVRSRNETGAEKGGVLPNGSVLPNGKQQLLWQETIGSAEALEVNARARDSNQGVKWLVCASERGRHEVLLGHETNT